MTPPVHTPTLSRTRGGHDGESRDAPRVRPLPPTEPVRGAGTEPVVDTRARRRLPTDTPDVPVPARRAAQAVVLMALEIVDRRRPPHLTRGAFPPHLVEMLRSLARDGVPGQDLGPARLHRLHITAVDAAAAHRPTDAPADYEVCASYARGPRLFAVAARIRVTATGASCTALRLI